MSQRASHGRAGGLHDGGYSGDYESAGTFDNPPWAEIVSRERQQSTAIWSPRYNSQGNPCYLYSQAIEISKWLTRVPEIPHGVVSACRTKSGLYLAHLRRKGVPPELLGVAGCFIPDLSGERLEEAYGTGRVMSRPVAPGMQTVDSFGFSNSVMLRGALVSKERSPGGREGVRVRYLGRDDPGWWLPFEGRSRFANHFVPVLRVAATPQDTLEWVTLEPDCSPPLWLPDWKLSQGLPESVLAVAPLGKHFQIQVDTLQEKTKRQALATLLGLQTLASSAEMQEVIDQLPPEEGVAIMRAFWNCDLRRSVPADHFYSSYSKSLAVLLGEPVWPILASARSTDPEIAREIWKLGETLRPLNSYRHEMMSALTS